MNIGDANYRVIKVRLGYMIGGDRRFEGSGGQITGMGSSKSPSSEDGQCKLYRLATLRGQVLS